MNKSCKNIINVLVVLCTVMYLCFSPALAANQIKLRDNIDGSIPSIPLKGGVNIDKTNQKITLSLRDSDIRQVLRMLADRSGVNIVMHNAVKGTVTVDLVNTSINKVFDYIMTLNQLTYWQDGNTIIIAPKTESAKLSLTKSLLKPIKIKYLEAGVVAKFLNSNIFSINKPDTSSNAIVTTNPTTNEVLIFGNENDIALAQKVINYLDIKPKMKTYTVNYIDAKDMASIICETIFKTNSNYAASGINAPAISGLPGTAAGSQSSLHAVTLIWLTIVLEVAL